MNRILSYNKDTDILIMLELDPIDLMSLSYTCKYFTSLLTEDFWYKKLQKYRDLDNLSTCDKSAVPLGTGNMLKMLFQVHPHIKYKDFYKILYTQYPEWCATLAYQNKKFDLVNCYYILRNCLVEKHTKIERNVKSIYYEGSIQQNDENIKKKQCLEEVVKRLHLINSSERRDQLYFYEKKYINWRNGKKHNTELITWKESEQLTINWKDGVKHGISEKWILNKNGKPVLLYRKNYKNGYLNGEQKILYHDTYKTYYYLNGKKI